ncbi:hypothetical protein A2954_05390 [Candidatus Roizmanbacteria bacterium RIFCSPLOWO2_01_FULL_37_12]|uniref:Uncharacterized protein n=1 Tax=Candidatus Roizmanbacteria bacterium RIFCSPLOWO2_01_FULL_37_12 TaxID=1802056 RepID=A0A1F7IDG3_9BACT|nr:MAG: hypothetical protein A3D76_03015 [Candidatus Roizmanbacteria bacterium RIFCSPHIGHO2_02_FULL_37_9b]OGK41390.1 MAG: hypothetical protein A2954_05390 [Candidatus Roizmanbacteria bacterium RIFCSPLOWO2_01_FULL_37_12]
MGKNKEIEKQEPIEISFGTVFVYAQNPQERYVVLDVEKKSWFAASNIYYAGGKEALGIPGTSYRSDILKIEGRWEKERIINALMVSMEVEKPIGRYFDLVREKSTQKSRILT